MNEIACQRTGQADNSRLDLEDTSLDGNYFQDFGMEFNGEEDLVNTFIDMEAPALIGGAIQNANTRAVSVENDLDISTSSNTQTKTKKKDAVIKGPSRRKKRPKGKPRRPLCGYNIFFQKHSKEIQATTAFKDLGRIMGERWKALTEEERAVYEKEAEYDVVRFRKEMDIYEKKRKERLCPTLELGLKDDIENLTGANYRIDASQPTLPNFQSPPGWFAAPATSIFPGFAPSVVPSIPSNNNIASRDYVPTPSPTPGLHVPGQFLGPAPFTAALPQGSEISLPDVNGATRKYRVVYACYRMTQKEANGYMAQFAAVTKAAMPQSPSPRPLSHSHPLKSPHVPGSTFLNPAVLPYHPTPHSAPVASAGDSNSVAPWPK